MTDEHSAAPAGTGGMRRASARLRQRLPFVSKRGERDAQTTVQAATYELLRRLEMTTVFGNMGSTEQPFLKNFPDDFEYVLALQETSAVAMADGFAQATRRPAFVNLHTGAGTGNALAAIMTAYQNRSPLVITAGQQTREMLLIEPYLTNVDETQLPRPWVKWAYQPARAQDVPAAIMRAYALALQPPAGPTFVSIPLDDWSQPALGALELRTVSARVAPDPERLAEFAERIAASERPLLVYGPEVDRSGGWEAGVAFAERLQAPVMLSPLSDRISFPLTHPLCRGMLPVAIGPASKRLEGHDLVIVVGAQVFRFYPYVAGEYLPAGTELLQIVADPVDAARAPVGDSVLGDARLALESLLELVPAATGRRAPAPPREETTRPSTPSDPLLAREAFAALGALRPDDAILVDETPSNSEDLMRAWPVDRPDSFFAFASGSLGWGGPAAVGIALAQKQAGSARRVVAVVGDGSLQYSIQCLYSAARQALNVVFVVPWNQEYAVLKNFAALEHTPNVPNLDLPGLDIVSIAKGYGCESVLARTTDEIQRAFGDALRREGPTVIVIPIAHELRSLVPEQH